MNRVAAELNMPISCPARLTCDTLSSVFQLAGEISETESENIEIDASALQFIDPFGLSVLAACCEVVAAKGRRVNVVALNPHFGGYLGRMDLFNQPWMTCSALKEAHRSDTRADLVELKRLTSRSEVDQAANALAQAMLGQVPGLDFDSPRDEMTGYNEWDRSAEPLCHVFTELLENGLTHARREGCRYANTWVSAQYYRANDRIHIGIVDTGCGFLGSLRQHPALKIKTHEAAILLALHPRVSCNRETGLHADSANAGIGLTTVYRIVRQASGRMLIASGNGVVREVGDGDGAYGQASSKSWQGTAIAINLPRKRLNELNIRDLMPYREFGRQAPSIRFE